MFVEIILTSYFHFVNIQHCKYYELDYTHIINSALKLKTVRQYLSWRCYHEKEIVELLVAGFLMTIMSGTMAFAVNADENANVLTAENAVIVENGIPRIISSAEAEKLLADGQEAETVLLHEQEQIIHDESIVDTYQTARATEYNFKVTNQATALWASDQKRVTPMVVGPATISSGESHTFTASYSGGITFTPAVLDSISATINLTKSASSNSSFTVTYTIAAGKTGYVVFTPKKRTTVGTLEEFSSYGYKTYKITVVDPVKISAYADGLYQLIEK